MQFHGGNEASPFVVGLLAFAVHDPSDRKKTCEGLHRTQNQMIPCRY